MHSTLEAELRRRFVVVDTPVVIGEHRLELVHPPSADDLISEEDFDRDERLPYWAEIWPSSRVLAERVAREQGAGRRLLELGCGVGLASFIAARVGFEAIATDYYLEATEFVRMNAARNKVDRIAARLVDWRDLPDDLGKFDIVVASDVLYERPNAKLVAATIARTLKPDGLAIVTDPGRLLAANFPPACEEVGLAIEKHDRVPIVEKDKTVTIDLREIRFASSK